MKIKLIPSKEITVEIDGVRVPGVFKVESEWNGLLKLVCTGPCSSIIIQKPNRVGNPYDYIAPIFGGGQAPEKMEAIEAEVLSTDIQIGKR